MRIKKISTLIIAAGIFQLAFYSPYCFAQDNAAKEEAYPVIETFRNHQLINAQTVEMLQPGGFEFKIQHRFGEIGYDERVYKDFLGLAGSANIRVSLIFPFTKRWYVGAGWSKNKKIADVESKFLLLRQTEENEIPVSVALYFNTATRTDEFPQVPENSFFSDSVTPFKYKFEHRVAYNFQLIIARKFTERISFQVTPAFIYKNLVNAGKQNYAFAIPVSGRYKYAQNSSIVFEYAYIVDKQKVFDDTKNELRNPVSIGVEFATSGHAFQIVMSSTNSIPEQEVYTNNSVDYLGRQGKTSFSLGFNIKRMLFFKK